MSKEKAMSLINEGLHKLSSYLCDKDLTDARDSYKYFEQALKELEEEV